ncbi:type VI secretion system baseplate subunit TssG [Chryseobacterium sp. MYb264]|uniref:type VI secretion system baseplate subunit TssG n=1 Tax=Chryseobacterium sp. MYb264 TaxID=2745153 RepID=UPI002E0DFAC4|nr:type VI secretion system baseplate subunit TssG [Chryseobacterium sp. MYb264]
MQTLTDLVHAVTSLHHDIRAEVVINDLLKNGDLSEAEYVVSKEGQFSRAYRFDILDAEITDYDLDSTQILEISLSRDGIYDMLPENLIHHIQNDTPGKEVDTMLREHRNQKKQQKGARTFFQPFENEMFTYGTAIERFERDFLSDLDGAPAADLFYDFWGISRDFPELLISKLIRILPFAYKIVGNISLACEILAGLLDEEVMVYHKSHNKYADKNESILLGESQLGLDFITGNSYDDYSSHFKIQIGPLKSSNFGDYIHQGQQKKFLDLYYDYFFPIEVEIETLILLPEEKQNFEFSTIESSVLGYNTRI